MSVMRVKLALAVAFGLLAMAPTASAGQSGTLETACGACSFAAWAAQFYKDAKPANVKEQIDADRLHSMLDDGNMSMAEYAAKLEQLFPPQVVTKEDAILLEKQHALEGDESAGSEPMSSDPAWQDPTSVPASADTPASSTTAGATESKDAAQPVGGYFSSGGYAADGFKQVDFWTSTDGSTTSQTWASPDGTMTVTETKTEDGTHVSVTDETGEEIYSSYTDNEGNTTSTTDGVGTTRCDQTESGCGDEPASDPEDPGSCDESDPACGDGSSGTAYVGADDATGATPAPPPGVGTPSTGITLAPPRIVQLGRPSGDGSDDTGGGVLRTGDGFVDPAEPPPATGMIGPATMPTPLPVRGAGPEFGPNGPETPDTTLPPPGPSTGPISFVP